MSNTNNHAGEQSRQDQSPIDAVNAVTLATVSPAPYKDLTFPLNVYAHMLLLQEGKVAYLHYGLFQHGQSDRDLQAAQQHSTELLMSRLPPPACRILEVGVGLGTTFSLLTQRGYDVHGITPDAQQMVHIHQSLGEQIPITCQRLEDFAADSARFDVILFRESAQYIEPLVIFNQALDLLSPSGHLFIIDEFALKRTEPGVEALHLLNDLLALARRFGFELIEQLDLSAMAAPTLDYLLRMSTVHRPRLIEDLALSEEKLTQLDASLRVYQEKYANGRYGYGLLHFRKKSPPQWRLRRLEQAQVPEMLALFEKTFNHPMTPATWQWKYGAERGCELGVWREKQLLAHYGGISRNILFFGQPQTAVQIGDVIVAANERGVLTKKGLFFLMAATFLERYIGYGKPWLVGFGFPNERAMKVAERHGLYAEVGQMIEISWPPLPRRPRWRTRLCPVNSAADEPMAVAVDECWRQMAADLTTAIVGIRDWRYLQQRYLNHPNQHYQVVRVKNRCGGNVRGILVLRHDTEESELVDIIAPLVAIPLLIIHARRLAGIHQAKRLFCRITENFAAHFAIAGGVRETLNIRIPANSWSAGPPIESLRGHWWLMSGDTDFR
ncbi:MAG: GNAT family N-acetyltransferase [Nitrosomonas sp.]|nr:GNAT family N-acetyltransferase [Nitrosomonas sp.]MDP1951905.1 GNAT family N-acetyltransferase [Nitrosomonas sp.]